MAFKLIVAGSRGINNYNYIKNKLDNILKNINQEIEIVSGGARGVDLLGGKGMQKKMDMLSSNSSLIGIIKENQQVAYVILKWLTIVSLCSVLGRKE